MRIAITVLIVSIFSNLSHGQLPFVDEIEILPENYEANFMEINEIVKSNYCHLKNKNINLDSLYKMYRSKLADANSKDEYFKYLLMYFSDLRNSHTTIYLREYGIEATAQLIEDRLFIKKVNDVNMMAAGVSANNEIIRINGVSSMEWLNQQRKYVSASTLEHELNKTLWKVFNNEFKEPRTYAVMTSNGLKTIKIQLEVPSNYRYTYPRDRANCVGKILNKSIAYIAINTMTGNIVTEFETAYDSLRKFPNLIIDLRNNYGGNSAFSEQITKYLIQSKQVACVSRSILKPNRKKYKGNLYILIGTQTASAAESFVIDLLESGKTTLIGNPTAGDTGNGPRNFTSNYGVSFRIPTRNPPQTSYYKKFPMEGTGVPPNLTSTQIYEDFMEGVDTALDYTINYINELDE